MKIEDFKHMLWSCRFSIAIWKETERQINERFRTNIEIKYHNVIMGFNPENCQNHAAINTIIMAVKKIILLTVVLLRVLRFLKTIPLLGGGMPPMITAVIKNM